MACGLNVWDYIDEEGTAELTDPPEPIPNDIKRSVDDDTPTRFSGLIKDQLEEYRNPVETIRAYVLTTVAREHVTFLLDQPIPLSSILSDC
jgi:hypothetical protein